MAGPPPHTASVTQYLHLAPTWALEPPASSLTPSSSTQAPPAPSSSNFGSTGNLMRPYSREEVKLLVLEYLCHEGHLETAKAFASEVQDGVDEGAKRDGAEIEATRNSGEHTDGTGTHGMEGVEATPEPESGESIRREEGTRESGTGGRVAKNGKSVAFDEGEQEEGLEEDEDCGLLSKDQVKDVRLRRSLRDAILSGQITYAVDLLQEHYTTVLASPTSTAASTLRLVDHTLNAPKRPEYNPQTLFVASPPSSTTPPHTTASAPPSYIPVSGGTFGTWATSLSPEILSLNLQTQVFIEHMRHTHASGTMSSPSTPASSVANGHTARPAASNPTDKGATAGGDEGSDAGMSASTNSLSSSVLLSTAISQSQALREKVLRLPLGKEREGWEKESIDVCGLLAYKDLASCPVRGYLAQSRREGLAEMVNAAIMQQTSRTPLPLLSLIARQTTAFWSTLREMHSPFPPASTVVKDTNGKDGKKAPKVYPYFDLHTFLRERDTTPAVSGNTGGGAAMQSE
ncbi:hypothetical protein JCM11641_008440 [Rhodosporidiobolus odoratus]